jgi:tRNA(Phe) wybutosine-synthesizing methylase Tyw3
VAGARVLTIVAVHFQQVMVTLVDTYKIEALVALNGKLVITKEYLTALVESGNRKLTASRERIERLRQVFEAQL